MQEDKILDFWSIPSVQLQSATQPSPGLLYTNTLKDKWDLELSGYCRKRW